MRSESEVNRAIEQYSNTIRRICFMYLKNRHDTEDIFQTVFLKYLLFKGEFENAEHEKAWFIRITINACKDFLKSFSHSRTIPLDVISEEAASVSDDNNELLQVVLSLPKKYKDVIYLFYYEGYTAPQISNILGKNENTIYTLLSRAKAMLKKELAGDME